ncbi:hypothetical protein TVAG_246220 [Trichomonas vaginalis G3]|uniref:carnosine N-methyltransferase n=1 Tax=Trichomonas vaginalis (strain ATCC PRA-98 / G3) TaxID=412133 RepID=A2E4S8_TRIV3|nr:carnosine N-methyltransferase protein [Trichomonas vaginalis G3]EAY12388.1 hypothetical protein TVAG_246220 [Trichomonas vaginalis G3]KAI5500805.1 carnosine N-methyltransferase protein [Trichomonas vaginalis G3]|eukprot:XP_001324611.1 hypothetical protein [Trichomonas vaginalis G3]
MWTTNERQEFAACLAAMTSYRKECQKAILKMHKQGLRTDDQLAKLNEAINNNANLFEYMAERGPESFGPENANMFPKINIHFDDQDLNQLDACLHSAARDWTSLGDAERGEVYSPVIAALHKYVQPNEEVLVPGSGLCRLAVEIAQSGFIAEANESSFVMLVMAFISMFSDGAQFLIFPFVHQISGLDKFEDSLISAVFPDLSSSLADPGLSLDPPSLIESSRLVLKAGKFEGVYANVSEKFGAIVTCFFIDVISDVQNTIINLHKLLKDGGIWINIGPIVNHNQSVGFFSPLTLEDIDRMARNAGFDIIEQSRIDTSYSQNPKTHVKTRYSTQFSVYRK